MKLTEPQRHLLRLVAASPRKIRRARPDKRDPHQFFGPEWRTVRSLAKRGLAKIVHVDSGSPAVSGSYYVATSLGQVVNARIPAREVR